MRAIVEAAAALADGSLEIGPGDDGAEQRERLLARRGIGPWTADYVRMRVLGDPDVLLPGDVAARAGAAQLGLPSDPAGFTAWSQRLAPWRSYAMAHYWYAAPVTQAWRSPAETAAARLSPPRRTRRPPRHPRHAAARDRGRPRRTHASRPAQPPDPRPRRRKRDPRMTTATLQFVDTPTAPSRSSPTPPIA